MVQTARATLRDTPGEVARDDIENFAAAPEAFDLAVSRLALHYVQDIRSVLRASHGYLAPGGRVVFTVLHPVITSHDPRVSKQEVRTNWVVDDYFVGGPREQAWLGGTVVWHHRTIEDYVTELRRAGFAERTDGRVGHSGLGNPGSHHGCRRIFTRMATPERVCEFGFPGPLRDRLVDAVLRGEKTATSALMVEWEEEAEPLPKVGEHQTVVDSEGHPVAVIELVAVDVIRLGDADLGLALEEGEGFRSVAEWRDDHERFWNDEVKPHLRGGAALLLDDDTQVVAQRFRLVERLPGPRP